MNEATGKQGRQVVGVSYDVDGDDAPIVMLKGAGPEAEQALAQARQLGDVPIVRDPDLVKQLYRVPLDAPIGRELFAVMATLLAHVIQFDRVREAQDNLRGQS